MRSRASACAAARTLCVVCFVSLALGARGTPVESVEPGADVEALRTVRFTLPYPLSGPREIQAADRATQRYRAVAAHAVPPITEVMARLIGDAVEVGGQGEVLRERRTALESLTRAETGARQRYAGVPHIVLAGDDVLLAYDLRRRSAQDGWTQRFRLIEPIAVMPFVLICASVRCASPADGHPLGLRAPRAFASAGEWTAGHRGAAMLRAVLDLNSLLIPYSGGSGAMSALLTDEADAAFVALPLALAYVGQAKIRALALASATRVDRLSNLPTLAELGIEGIRVEGWFALFGSTTQASNALPALAAAARAYRLEPASRAELLARGLVPIEASAAAFAVRMHAERQQWRARIGAGSNVSREAP